MTSENLLQPLKYCSQDELPVVFDYVLNSGSELGMAKFYALGELIRMAESVEVLMQIVSEVRKRGFLLHTASIDNLTDFNGINEVRTTARLYSLYFLHQFFEQYAKSLQKLFRSKDSAAIALFTLPKLIYSVDGYTLTHNLDEASEQIQILLVMYAKEYADGKPRVEQEEHFDRLIQATNDLNFLSGGNTFDDAIKYLKTARKHIPRDTPADSNEQIPFHHFTRDGYKLFNYLLEEGHNAPQDISFFYRVMFADKYIVSHPQAFLHWYNAKYSTEISQLKQIGQIATKDRKAIYSQAKQLYNT